jgi:hypothetical protein
MIVKGIKFRKNKYGDLVASQNSFRITLIENRLNTVRYELVYKPKNKVVDFGTESNYEDCIDTINYRLKKNTYY